MFLIFFFAKNCLKLSNSWLHCIKSASVIQKTPKNAKSGEFFSNIKKVAYLMSEVRNLLRSAF